MGKNIKRLFAIILGITMALPNTMLASANSDNRKPRLEEGNYVVVLKDDKEYEKIMSKYQDDITNDFEEYDNNVITADITSKEAKRLEKEQGVISVEKNITLSGLFNENDQITGLSEILKDSNVTYEELKKRIWNNGI